MNKLFLNIVMLPSGIWKGMGADVAQLRAILSVRLMMDDRKPLSFGRPQRQKKPRKFSTLLSMVINFVMGILYMFPLLVVENRVLSMLLFFTMFTALLTFMLVADFSNVLFDTRDKFIILPRPINDQTIFLSRLLHVLIYLFRIVLPMALPTWIYLGIADGWKSALLFPVPLLLTIFLTIFLVNACYLLILRFSRPERFKEIINYFQIVFTLLIFFVTYFMPRLVQSSIFTNPDPKNFMWARFIPAYWLASCWSWIGMPMLLPKTQWLSILAVVLPLVLMWVTVKWLSPYFGKKIGAIDVVEVSEHMHNGKKAKEKTLYKRLAYALNSTSAAQAGFMIAWLQTGRSRTFKMRVYPMFAYAPVIFVYSLINNRKESISETWHSLSQTPLFLVLLYLCIVTVLQAINYISFSEQYKAAWIYYSSPVEKPGRVMIGAFKAIWLKYFMPFFIIISIFIISVWGWTTILDMILAVTNMAMFSLVILRVSYRNFPFSLIEQMSNSGNRIVKSLLAMMIPGLMGMGHYLAVHIWWLKLIFLALSCILLWLVWDSYANTSWESMKKVELE